MIAHGCNSRGVMASGVAAAIASRWPEVKRRYEQESRSYPAGLPMGTVAGGFVLVNDNRPPGEKMICNVITQERYGRNENFRYVSYDAVDEGMRIVAKRAPMWVGEKPTVAIPMIGAGLGNGKWSVIESILEEITKETGVKFNVYVPEGAVYRSLIRGLRS